MKRSEWLTSFLALAALVLLTLRVLFLESRISKMEEWVKVQDTLTHESAPGIVPLPLAIPPAQK